MDFLYDNSMTQFDVIIFQVSRNLQIVINTHYVAYKALGQTYISGPASGQPNLCYAMPTFERPNLRFTGVVRAIDSCMLVRPTGLF